ncbi:MAG: Acyl dehydratase [Rhodobacteraceae bacterium HLUCCA12]|nr:MAG: Acyl dehydratase [Rhodobacteraceae bacterium HLUCCA12]
MKYLEDYHTGQVFHRQSRPMSAEGIMDFAREWDPQRLHLDADFATAMHGSLIASGFQTMLHAFQPFMHDVFSQMENIGGLGLDNLRWRRPVRPDEVLDLSMEITAVTPSRSKPDRGVLGYRISARNPAGEEVFCTDCAVMIRRRPAP